VRKEWFRRAGLGDEVYSRDSQRFQGPFCLDGSLLTKLAAHLRGIAAVGMADQDDLEPDAKFSAKENQSLDAVGNSLQRGGLSGYQDGLVCLKEKQLLFQGVIGTLQRATGFVDNGTGMEADNPGNESRVL